MNHQLPEKFVDPELMMTVGPMAEKINALIDYLQAKEEGENQTKLDLHAGATKRNPDTDWEGAVKEPRIYASSVTINGPGGGGGSGKFIYKDDYEEVTAQQDFKDGWFIPAVIRKKTIPPIVEKDTKNEVSIHSDNEKILTIPKPEWWHSWYVGEQRDAYLEALEAASRASGVTFKLE